jgi:hypothetical protein
MFRFLGFYLCYAIPTSLLLSQDSGLDYFLLILLPATESKLWALDIVISSPHLTAAFYTENTVKIRHAKKNAVTLKPY